LNTIANCVAVYFVLQFVWSYYRTCYRKGYKLDLWHIWLVQTMFTIHVMLPFNRSRLNVFALGPALMVKMLPMLNKAYLISAFGYAFILIGGQLWRLELGSGLRRTSSDVMSQLVRWPLLMARTPRFILITGGTALCIMMGIIGYYFTFAGFAVNLRGFLLVYPALRPIGNFAAFLAIQSGSLALARYVEYRERTMLWLFMALCLTSVFYGSRGMILAMGIAVLTIWLVRQRMQLKFWKALLVIYGGLLFSFTLNAARAQQFTVSRVLFSMGSDMFYGNSYSDTRDFAVVLGFWDGHYFYGLTYLAGLMAFVPRFLSSFRDKWSYGVVTATLVGFKPTEHPGLRIGLFGEAYLNFGLLGVILVGLSVGYMLRWMDLSIKAQLEKPTDRMLPYAYVPIGSIMAFIVNTTAGSSLYTLVFLFLFCWAAIKVSRAIKLPLA